MKRIRNHLWDEYTLEELSKRTGYSMAYLQDVRRGAQPTRPRFRMLVSRFLGEGEDKLFAETNGEI